MNHRLLLIRSREAAGRIGRIAGAGRFCAQPRRTLRGRLRAKAFAEHQGRKPKAPGAVTPPPEPAPYA